MIRPSRKAARRRRAESKVVKVVRPVVADRDGDCRLYVFDLATRANVWRLFGACCGLSEWAHRREHSRAKTRGMVPDARHTTATSLQLCSRHHQDDRYGYDRSAFRIEDLTDLGCDGRLRFVRRDGQTWEEPA